MENENSKQKTRQIFHYRYLKTQKPIFGYGLLPEFITIVFELKIARRYREPQIFVPKNIPRHHHFANYILRIEWSWCIHTDLLCTYMWVCLRPIIFDLFGMSFFITLIPHNVREVGMYPAVEAKIRSPCLIGMSCHRYVCQVLFHYKWNF